MGAPKLDKEWSGVPICVRQDPTQCQFHVFNFSAAALSRHHRLRQGRDFQLARFAGDRGGGALLLGISPSAWEAAQSVMGEIPAAVVVAAILQRGAAIMSVGGYLRELTRKAAVGEFTVGPTLMALIGARKCEMKRA